MLLLHCVLFIFFAQAMATFSITAQSGTDAWRKPPSTDVFNGPFIPIVAKPCQYELTLRPCAAPTASGVGSTTTNPLRSFVAASVAFRFTPMTRYDQGGLVLALRRRNATDTSIPPKWIKTGIEYYEDASRVGTVGTDAFSDWSIAPVSTENGIEFEAGKTWTTVRVEKHVDELGDSLWVYQVVGEQKLPLREINWPYGYGDDWELKVEAYAAKPGEGEPLVVEFKDFNVEWQT
jgi:regulation of enolase protein 1 (concanavalin A-like superfamily)